MKKIKVSEKQAKMLENLNSKKVVKITQEQYNRILQLESEHNLGEAKFDNRITKNFLNNLPSGKLKSDHKLEVRRETKIKSVMESQNMWESFINELYSLNEGNGNMYETLIKLMEIAGYVNEGKVVRGKFNNNVDMVKEVIISGLNEMANGCSEYRAVEKMNEVYESIKLNDELENRKTKLVTTKNDIESGMFNNGEDSEEPADEIDTITMDIPLFLRMLEYAREDAKDDMDLHVVTKNALELNKGLEMLTMDNYTDIVGNENSEMGEPEENNMVELNEDDLGDAIVGLDVLNYSPFSDLPETRAEVDWSNRPKVYLPAVDGEGMLNILSKADMYGYETQGPKMVHKFPGYISDFKNKFGEDPIFININQKGADIANPSFMKRKEMAAKVKGDTLASWRKESDINMDEVTSASSSGAFVGAMSGGNKFKSNVPNEMGKFNEEQIEEATTTVSAGNYQYATPGFASSEFFGTKGKKGKAPVNKGITHKKTVWSGGKFVTENTDESVDGFVEFDDCTKLNNNKEAQKGKCSVGAVDNVVKVKKFKK